MVVLQEYRMTRLSMKVLQFVALSAIVFLSTKSVFSRNNITRRRTTNSSTAAELQLSSSTSEQWNNLPTIVSDNVIKTVSNGDNSVATTLLHDYYKAMVGEQSEMVLFKWNSLGELENYTDLSYAPHLNWIHSFLDNDFKQTTPSEHGKVAMIFACDVIVFLPWEKTPPIPLLLYTIYKDHYESPNLILMPNPYDQSGFSEWQVDNLLTKHQDILINTTIDEFHQRDNTLMWRGSDHGERIRIDLIEYAQKEEKIISETSSETKLWLNAKLSGGHDASGMTEEDLATKYKYHLDVGGVSGTSWEGLRWKMCSGNLVFHIDSGSMDWWHIHIQPGVHYLEIKEDLSNLREQYDWAESHPNEAYEIAQRGQQACLDSYKKDVGKQRAIEIIHSLPDATPEQIMEVDQMIEEYYSRKNNRD